MARLAGLLILLALVGYGLWPYYSLFQLNRALNAHDTEALAPLVDLTEVRTHYKGRISEQVGAFAPEGDSEADKVLRWLTDNLKQLGDAALDQAITLEWVRDMLLNAIARATGPQERNLIAAVDFAFFESWDRFVVRLGELGEAPTFVILTFADGEWRVTDMTR
jgi:hypothetical protein